MTKRQFVGFAVFAFSMLALAATYAFVKIYWFTPPKWTFFIASLLALGWGAYYKGDFAKKSD